MQRIWKAQASVRPDSSATEFRPDWRRKATKEILVSLYQERLHRLECCVLRADHSFRRTKSLGSLCRYFCCKILLFPAHQDNKCYVRIEAIPSQCSQSCSASYFFGRGQYRHTFESLHQLPYVKTGQCCIVFAVASRHHSTQPGHTQCHENVIRW